MGPGECKPVNHMCKPIRSPMHGSGGLRMQRMEMQRGKDLCVGDLRYRYRRPGQLIDQVLEFTRPHSTIRPYLYQAGRYLYQCGNHIQRPQTASAAGASRKDKRGYPVLASLYRAARVKRGYPVLASLYGAARVAVRGVVCVAKRRPRRILEEVALTWAVCKPGVRWRVNQASDGV
jgi:hypothetical protein